MSGRAVRWHWPALVVALLAALVAYPHPERAAPKPRSATVLRVPELEESFVSDAVAGGAALVPYASTAGIAEIAGAEPRVPTREELERSLRSQSSAELWIVVERASGARAGRALIWTSRGAGLDPARIRGTLTPSLVESWVDLHLAGSAPAEWAPVAEEDEPLLVHGSPAAPWPAGSPPPGWTFDEGRAQRVVFAPSTATRPAGYANAASTPATLVQRAVLPPHPGNGERTLVLAAHVVGQGATVRAVLPGGRAITLVDRGDSGGGPERRAAPIPREVASVTVEIALPSKRAGADSAVVAGVSLRVTKAAPEAGDSLPLSPR